MYLVVGDVIGRHRSSRHARGRAYAACDLGDDTAKFSVGIGIDAYDGGVAQCYLGNIVLADVDDGFDPAHIGYAHHLGTGHHRVAYDTLAFFDAQQRDHAIDGRYHRTAAEVLGGNVQIVPRTDGAGLVAPNGLQRRHVISLCCAVGALRRFVFRKGNYFFVEQLLFAIQRPFGRFHGDLEPRQLFLHIGHHGLLLVHLCRGLITLIGEDVRIYFCEYLAFMYAVAFLLDTQLHDLARDIGADLYFFFRIDFPACSDDLGDITPGDILRRDSDAGVPAQYAFEQNQ